jgi:HSP20 family protein
VDEPAARWGLDVEEKDNQLVVRAEAPGFEPSEFDVQVVGDQLVLKATHKAEKEDKDKKFQSWEQRELYRSVTLPQGVDPEKVDASYKNGVLMITLPKAGKPNGKKIPIKG